MTRKLINKLIIEYMLKNNVVIKRNGIVVRAFTEEYYNNLMERDLMERWRER